MSKQVTVPQKYEMLLDKLEHINSNIRGTFIDSPMNHINRAERDDVKKKIKEFQEEFPEVLI